MLVSMDEKKGATQVPILSNHISWICVYVPWSFEISQLKVENNFSCFFLLIAVALSLELNQESQALLAVTDTSDVVMLNLFTRIGCCN